MAINFTKNIEKYATTQRNARAKQFMEFTSKKQLQDAEVLTDKELKFVTSIKGTFSFALHNDGRYMAITLYRANAERKYNFLILDLQEEAVAEVDSIKNAKAEILDLVQETPAEEQETSAEPKATEDEKLANAVKGLLDEVLNEDENEKKSRKASKTA